MSQSQIGNLMVALGVNTAQFTAGLASAQGSLSKFGDHLKSFAAAAGVTLSFGAIGLAVKSTIDHMDELSKTAQKIGIPVEELSKLEYAAKLADLSLDDLSGTLAKFSKNISEIAAGGDNDAGKALTAMGLSATDAAGKLKPTTQIISDIAEEFAAMRDGAGKTALAIALFGKSGAEMIPLLNGGKEAIAGASAELERFGGVVTQEAASEAENFNDNITRLQTAFDSLTQQMVAPLLPTMINLGETLIELAKNSNTAGGAVEGMKNLLKQAAIVSANAYETFYALGQVVSVFQQNFSDPQGMTVAGERWSTALERIRMQAEETQKAIDKINNPGITASQSDVNSMLDSIGGKKGDGKKAAPLLPPSSGVSSGVPKIAKPGTADDIYGKGFTKGLDDAKEAFNRLWDEMDAGIPVQDDVSNGFQDMADTISNSLSYALEGLLTGTMSVKEAFTSMAQSISQQLAQLASELIKSSILKVLQIMLGGGGGAGFNIGGMTFGGLYADGGTLGSGKWGIAGEAGPELIKGPASITPMDKLAGGQAPQMNVTVINNSSAAVQTRKNSKGDLEVMIEEVMADKLLRGGNKVDAALQRGFGLRRAGR